MLFIFGKKIKHPEKMPRDFPKCFVQVGAVFVTRKGFWQWQCILLNYELLSCLVQNNSMPEFVFL